MHLNLMNKMLRQLTPICRLHALLLCFAFTCLYPFTRLVAQCSPDVTPPDITCPANVTETAPLGQCNLTIAIPAPTVSDNCAGTPVWLSDAPPGNAFPLGESFLVYSATDAAGNTATCQITVTIDGGIAAAACNDMISRTLEPFFGTTIDPDDLLEGGPYNCATTGLSLNATDTPTPTLTFYEGGSHTVYGCVSTPEGGWNRCWGTVEIVDPCVPDVTPPTHNCDPFTFVETNTTGPNIGRLYAADLDNGSTDNCTHFTNLKFRVTDVDGTIPPTTPYIDLVEVPEPFETYLWIGDDAGNWSKCIVLTVFVPTNCTPDQVKPSVTAPPDVSVTAAEFAALDFDFFNFPEDADEIRAAFGQAAHWDNCSNDNSALQESFVISSDQILRRFFVTDAANNLNDEAFQYIHILNTFNAHVPGWLYPGDPSDTMSYYGDDVSTSYTDLVYAYPPCGEAVLIEREWGLVDWEFTPSGGEPAVLPALDLDNDGIFGDPYNIIAIGDSIWLYQNYLPVQPLIERAWSYTYQQQIRNSYPITGTVFIDTLTNCSLDGGEPLLENWKVKIVGQPSNAVYTGLTDANGVFNLHVCPGDTAVEVSLDVPFNYGGSCSDVYVLHPSLTESVSQNIPVQLNEECTLLSVDIATPYLRPCFTGFYAISYHNYSDQTVAGTYVDVALDTFVEYQSSTLSGTLQSGNTYRFATGTLSPGESGSFQIHYLLDCEVTPGATHCTEASIYPETVCDPEELWSGAELRVTGQCDGDSVRVHITNVGSAAMADELKYVVTEDLIMARTEYFQLGLAGVAEAVFPASGATWRVETKQEPGHPWGGIVSATIEGCGGLNTPGLVNLFSVDDNDPFTATDCTENTSSFDPNDKQGFPKGYGQDHFIERNTDIEYMIRFQNTGTDTAFTVVLLDTLSTFLDAASIRTGASSHEYDFDMIDGNVLRFRFDNILLPDSNTNEAASHGFVKFRVPQQPGLPLGTVIHNSAAIYFDFNDPVITNQTWHTIGENFVDIVAVNDPKNLFGNLRVYPNPASETVFFELSEPGSNLRFELTNTTGRLVRTADFSGKVFRLERAGLPAGVYLFRMRAENGAVVTGKVMMR